MFTVNPLIEAPGF